MFSTACVAGQRIASDALNHASIIDGIRLSKAHKTIVPHLQPDQIPHDTDLIAIEGLFSMDGDCPDLTRYPTKPWLAVDEAHALGCIGPDGRGVAASQHIEPDILIGTFGKALGAAGAFVVAHQDFIDLLINAGRAFIYTTAPPETLAQMALQGLTILREEGEELRGRLNARTHELRKGLRQLGLEPLGSAHIVPVILKEQTMSIANALLEKGFTPLVFDTLPWPTEKNVSGSPSQRLSCLEADRTTVRCPGSSAPPPLNKEEATDGRKTRKISSLGQASPLASIYTQKRWTSSDPLIIERGEGNWLIDDQGRKYLDGVSSLWTTVHGHTHPHLNQAIQKQLETLSHSTMLGLTHPTAIEFAAQLVEKDPKRLTRVFYSDSGSTATEIAIKMAYQAQQQQGETQKDSIRNTS